MLSLRGEPVQHHLRFQRTAEFEIVMQFQETIHFRGEGPILIPQGLQTVI